MQTTHLAPGPVQGDPADTGTGADMQPPSLDSVGTSLTETGTRVRDTADGWFHLIFSAQAGGWLALVGAVLCAVLAALVWFLLPLLMTRGDGMLIRVTTISLVVLAVVLTVVGVTNLLT